MATAKRRIAGAQFKIGTTAADMATDTYTQIEGARMSGGGFGGTWQVQDTTDLEDTAKQETKTLLDPATVDLEMHEVVGDTGQGNLKTAFEDVTDAAFNFEIAYPSGDKRRFKAKVLSYDPQGGGPTSIRMIRSRLSLTAASTYVAAT